jgi:hypothetical protein
MADLHQRIAQSFAAQGLMTTLGARLAHVAHGEVHVAHSEVHEALPYAKHLSQQRG